MLTQVFCKNFSSIISHEKISKNQKLQNLQKFILINLFYKLPPTPP